MENVQQWVNMILVASETRALKLVSKPNFKRFEIIKEELVLIEMLTNRLLLNKPIYTEFAVMELSKQFFHQNHYAIRNNAKLLFTDTDSFCCHTTCIDLYSDIEGHLDFQDTSNNPEGHRL
jgi:hypothetical protein